MGWWGDSACTPAGGCSPRCTPRGLTAPGHARGRSRPCQMGNLPAAVPGGRPCTSPRPPHHPSLPPRYAGGRRAPLDAASRPAPLRPPHQPDPPAFQAPQRCCRLAHSPGGWTPSPGTDCPWRGGLASADRTKGQFFDKVHNYWTAHARHMVERTSRTHSHKPLNLVLILFIGYIDLKNNQNRIKRF